MWSAWKPTSATSASASTIYPAPDNYVSVKYGWYGTVTGRLGLAYDRLLTYVKGGAAVASITNSAADLNGSVIDPSDFSETKKTRWGWTVGTGFEIAVAPSWSVKSEYMYMDFGRHSSTNLDGDTFQHKNQVAQLQGRPELSLGRRVPGADRRALLRTTKRTRSVVSNSGPASRRPFFFAARA